MKQFRHSVHIISQEIFTFSLLTYLALMFAEIIKKDSIGFFFNPHLLLIVIFFSGIITILTYQKDSLYLSSHKPSWGIVTFVCFFVVAGGSFFMLLLTQTLGVISLVVSLIAGIILFVFSLLLVN